MGFLNKLMMGLLLTQVVTLAPSSIHLNWHVKETSVYVECDIPGVTYKHAHANHRTKPVGEISVTVDGEPFDTFHSPAFILKRLPPGVHRIEVTLVPSSDSPYNETESFIVDIPHAK
ncbi:hypothetical protein [Aureibacillus halotolerans]|uniref:Uncharacterized protein n=1 Tax=Aureibacillus halotolerans TaxID=1508390 RepID=A0A4R6U7H5_9BACI|nr:hypothetical protein [Aureibacillus halotolerans]TDQ42301.1 hypothetical protein EV213_102332 [Aureibacillus halotolerans]